MAQLLQICKAFPLKLLLGTLLLSQMIGQWHPFSRFPMYSSFPPTADLYYACKPTGELVPTVPVLGVFAQELKQRIEHQYEAYGQGWGNDSLLQVAAGTILSHIVEEQGWQEGENAAVEIRKVELSRSQGKLIQKESRVAQWP